MDLINWLFQMQPHVKLQSVSIHVAINIVDRYLSKRQMVPTAMKLLGIGALRTACIQTEQRTLPTEILIQHATKYKVKSWNIEEMQDLITSLLHDKLKPPTVLCFLNVYARASGIIHHMKIYNLARFLSDMSVLVHQNSIFLPSIIAMCILRFALRRVITQNKQGEIPVVQLTRKLQSTMMHSSISEKEVSLCARELHLNLCKF